MEKNKINHNFSQAAFLYDDFSGTQKKCADILINKIVRDTNENILEIGCGTGFYTSLLDEKFRSSNIWAIDISEKMLEAAKNKKLSNNTNCVFDDGESYYSSNKFDLVTSNSVFQWMENFEYVIDRYVNMLTSNGEIFFSCYGPDTFYELDAVIGGVLGNDSKITASGFKKKDFYFNIMKKYFNDVSIEENCFVETFDTLYDFFRVMKKTGVTGAGLGIKKFWGRQLLAMMEKEYLDRFSTIKCTHQVFFVSCKMRKI
ncbi:MAG: methyltransferase domain-containing protein [Candidatus Omnitrophica bacterium]|nr:methyltransferase domain-containing protein [Candidatus Omnitrophota bacterium]